jgi:hypothetical protein
MAELSTFSAFTDQARFVPLLALNWKPLISVRGFFIHSIRSYEQNSNRKFLYQSAVDRVVVVDAGGVGRVAE